MGVPEVLGGALGVSNEPWGAGMSGCRISGCSGCWVPGIGVPGCRGARYWGAGVLEGGSWGTGVPRFRGAGVWGFGGVGV